MKDNILNKNKKDWENFVRSKEKLPDKDSKIHIKKIIKTRSIDLHGYSLDEANKTIRDFIMKSFDEGLDMLKIITGKGIHSDNKKNPYVSQDLGILKYSVPDFISNNKELKKLINEFKEVPTEVGGDGAFYIILKKKL